MAEALTTDRNDIAEALKLGQKAPTAKAREPFLTAPDDSGRLFLFDDAAQLYNEVARFDNPSRSVGNIESLAALVTEQLRRNFNEKGEGASVTFCEAGATFIPVDIDNRIKHEFTRTLSPQWCRLTQNLNRPMPHVSFVRLLQELRPSIVEYPTVIREFRKVSFDAGIKIDSAPTLEGGKAGNSYQFEIQAKGSATRAALPSTVKLRLPFARSSEALYDLDLEVDISLQETAEKKTIVFTLLFPDVEAVREQAIEAEIKWFREQVSGANRLLILKDF